MKNMERVNASHVKRNEFVDKALALGDSGRKRIKREEVEPSSALSTSPGAASSSTYPAVAAGRGPGMETGETEGGKRPGDDREDGAKRQCGRAGSLEDMELGELDVNQEDEFDIEENWAVDDLSGKELDPKLVHDARKEEVSFMEGLGVWVASSRNECIEMTGKEPVTTKWVDVNKGRDGEVLIRSRLVARDFKGKHEAHQFEVFAAMPPLEAKRLLFRMAMVEGSIGGDERRGRVKLMFIDVKKAHLNGCLKSDEHAFVGLPDEAGGGVAKLRRWLYGMRPAASAWEDDYAVNMGRVGLLRGRAAPTTFVHQERGLRLVVWGDDFTFLGREEDLKWIAKLMSEWYDIKIRAIVGPGAGDDKEVRILNRSVTWMEDRIEYEGGRQACQDDHRGARVTGRLEGR